jgi:putative DNA primase/helicase
MLNLPQSADGAQVLAPENRNGSASQYGYPDVATALALGGALSQKHVEKLAMISPEIIQDRKYTTVTESKPLEGLDFPSGLAPGLLIPWHDVHGKLRDYQFRPDIPRKIGRSTQKYLFRKGRKNFADVPPRCVANLGNPKIPLWITEGPIKADALASQGATVIGLAGVSGWHCTNEQGGKVPIACFREIALNGRVVYLCFDSDLKGNAAIFKDALNLKQTLESRGATVFIIEIPPDVNGQKQGPDDFLLNGGTLEQLQSFALIPGKQPKPRAQASEAEAESDFRLDDIGNGKRYAAQNGADMRFCSSRLEWQIHKSGHWQPDKKGEAERRAKKTGLDLAAEASREESDNRRARLLVHAEKLTRRNVRETMLKDAASEPGMTVTPEDFDTALHLLNLANGTFDLASFEFRPHCAADLLSHQSPVVYDAAAECPLWNACMRDWLPDAPTRDYVQETAGVTVSGIVPEEFFNFLFGDGDNGKSTFMYVLEKLAGSYWHKTQAETLMTTRDKRKAGAPSPELLALKGARLVTAHEVDSKQHLNAALIKDLTGRDSITARGVFEKYETTFEPQFTLWMIGNSRPQIHDTSGGMWRRVRLIGFTQTFPADKRDPQLRRKLLAELPGILNWALEGLRRVNERGLLVPDAVKVATAQYQAEQDTVSGFVNDCCVTFPQSNVSKAELWTAWCEWCRANGEREGAQRALGTELKRRKFEDYKGNTGWRWRGIGLKAEGEPNPQTTTDITDIVTQFPIKSNIENTSARDFIGNCVGNVGYVSGKDNLPIAGRAESGRTYGND